MAYTLNQFIKLVEGYVAAHKQLNTFQFGHPYDYSESEQVVYPAVFMTPATISIGTREMTANYSLFFADRIDNDSPADTDAQVNEVLSDMRDCALDIMALLNDPANGDNFNINREATMEHFVDRLKDLTAGWVVDIQIRQPMLYDRCQVPR